MKKILFLILVASCAACDVVIDNSQAAVDSGDYTLISAIKGGLDAQSSCIPIPSGGFSACRFTEGTKISSVWNIVLPSGDSFVSGQLTAFYKDISKSYAVTGSTVSIPFSDFFQSKTWSKDLDGEIEAVAILQYKDNSGIQQTARALGIARIVVVSSSYTVLPLDSGVQAWGTTVKCKIQYSTAGRSAVSCR